MLSTKSSVQFDAKQDEWCMVANFKQMYDNIYSQMVEKLCCAMIIAAMKMNALVPVGHQAWADVHGNGEGNFEASSDGDDKLHPLVQHALTDVYGANICNMQ